MEIIILAIAGILVIARCLTMKPEDFPDNM